MSRPVAGAGLLLVLMAGTIAFFMLYDRYQVVGPQLLGNPDFNQGLEGWEQAGRGRVEVQAGGVILEVREPGSGVALRQTLSEPGRFRLLRLSGELEARAIHPGPRFWQQGRLVLVSLNDKQRMLPVPHLVADLAGNRAWATYRQVFSVPRRATELQVRLQLIGATGRLAVRWVGLHEVEERPGYRWYRSLGLALWSVALVWLVWPYRNRLRFDRAHLLLYLAVLGVFVGTLMPVELKQPMEKQMIAVLNSLLPVLEHRLTSDSINKSGHFLFFAMLAFGAVRVGVGQRPWGIGMGLVLLAALSEVLQFFVEGRRPRLTDLLVDALGIALGMALAAYWHHRSGASGRCETRHDDGGGIG